MDNKTKLLNKRLWLIRLTEVYLLEERHLPKLMIIEIKIVENILWGKKSWRCWKISDLWL